MEDEAVPVALGRRHGEPHVQELPAVKQHGGIEGLQFYILLSSNPL